MCSRRVGFRSQASSLAVSVSLALDNAPRSPQEEQYRRVQSTDWLTGVCGGFVSKGVRGKLRSGVVYMGCIQAWFYRVYCLV